jgi:uncharacterized protein (TIGR02145 family)
MKTLFAFLILALSNSSFLNLNAQVGINNDGSSPNSSAILDVKSTTKGVLFPRMNNEQIEAIPNPANGLVVFCTTDNKFYAYIAGGTSGIFTSTGAQTVNLMGIGTPVADQIDNFTTTANIGGGTCTFSITVQPWQCGIPISDSRDGQFYNTVLIGSQCWLAENMNIGTMISNTVNQSNNGYIEKYCYNGVTGSCTSYGGLYQWGETMQYSTDPAAQGICPAGWHVPTDHEWKVLEGYVDSNYPIGDPVWDGTSWRGSDAGQRLKSTTTWYMSGNGTDLYGFTALPAGYRYINPPNYSFWEFGAKTYFWTSSEETSGFPWIRALEYSINQVYRNEYNQGIGSSVRCLLDN